MRKKITMKGDNAGLRSDGDANVEDSFTVISPSKISTSDSTLCLCIQPSIHLFALSGTAGGQIPLTVWRMTASSSVINIVFRICVDALSVLRLLASCEHATAALRG
jgi:hypothetical protein